MIKLLRESVDGITREGVSWLKVLIRLSCLVLAVLAIYSTYHYAKSVVYHLKNRADIEKRMLEFEKNNDWQDEKILELQRQIEKLK